MSQMQTPNLFDVVSPSILSQKNKPLNFRYEALRYRLHCKENRSKPDYHLISRFSSKIKLSQMTDTITAIVDHIHEPDLIKLLSNYKTQKNELKKHHIVIFFNADKIISKKNYKNALIKQTRIINSFLKISPSLKVSILSHHFSEVTIGRLRGLITDAIVFASLANKLVNPILISNDADTFELSQSYLKNIKLIFKSKPKLDILRGIVYEGYDHKNYCLGINSLNNNPEIFMSAHYWTARLIVTMKDRDTRFAHVPLTGQNFAIRLSSYCAIGGYSYTLKHSEDSHLGLNFQHIRLAQSKRLKDIRNFIEYSSKPFVVVNPRRTVDSLLSGNNYNNQWTNYASKSGPKLSLDELNRKYLRRKQFIQLSDIKNAKYKLQVQNKIKRRIKMRFLNEAKVDSLAKTPKFLKNIASQYGLEIKFKKLNTKSKMNNILKRMIINWNKSVMYNYLLKLRFDESK